MQRAIEAFLEMMVAERGVSPRTVEAYRRDLKQLSLFLKDKDVSYISKDDLKEYLALKVSEGFSERTQTRLMSSMREFFRFLYSENQIKVNPTDYLVAPKLAKPLPKYLSEKEISSIIEYAREHKNIRLWVLLEMLYATGMRVSELVCLPISVVSQDTSTLCIMGKGQKQRYVPMNPLAQKALSLWLIEREVALKRPSKWLFPSKSKEGHLTRDGFFKALKEVAIKVSIAPERVSPHVFRHSFASHLIAHDVDLRSVQKMLGHVDISTTEIYTHLQEDRLKKIVEKSHPLSYNAKKGF